MSSRRRAAPLSGESLDELLKAADVIVSEAEAWLWPISPDNTLLGGRTVVGPIGHRNARSVPGGSHSAAAYGAKIGEPMDFYYA
jgi:hypothetical protein